MDVGTIIPKKRLKIDIVKDVTRGGSFTAQAVKVLCKFKYVCFSFRVGGRDCGFELTLSPMAMVIYVGSPP